MLAIGTASILQNVNSQHITYLDLITLGQLESQPNSSCKPDLLLEKGYLECSYIRFQRTPSCSLRFDLCKPVHSQLFCIGCLDRRFRPSPEAVPSLWDL